MVDEVETIVRNIEDQKANKEIRDKTRDVFARIEGLEAEKVGTPGQASPRSLTPATAGPDGAQSLSTAR